MKTLETTYRYTLNDQVVDEYRKNKNELKGKKFPSLSRTHSSTRRIKNNYANKFICLFIYLYLTCIVTSLQFPKSGYETCSSYKHCEAN